MAIQTRITDMLGIEKPIIQAAMGWIARAQLSSAICNAGGMGIIETSSGELDAVREEILKMHDLTDKPFGVNVAQAFVRDPKIIDFIIDQGVKFVTTSAGDPKKYTALLKEAGLTVFHVVPSLKGALRAIEAGVDGLIVEGGEGGGFKNPNDVASMVLIPQVCEAVDVPVVAAGGITDGRSMAAAFALGAFIVVGKTPLLMPTPPILFSLTVLALALRFGRCVLSGHLAYKKRALKIYSANLQIRKTSILAAI